MKSPNYVLKEARWFACFDDSGQIVPCAESLAGIYFQDVRLVSGLQYRFEDIDFSALWVDDSQTHRLRFHCTNQSFMTRFTPGALELCVDKFTVSDGYIERLEFVNRAEFAIEGHFEISLQLDFSDLIEVRQILRDRWEREWNVRQVDEYTINAHYKGRTGYLVSTAVRCDRPIELREQARLAFPIALEPDERWNLELTIGASIGGADVQMPEPAASEQRLEAAVHDWRASLTHIETDNEEVNRVLARSADDLRALWLGSDDSGCFAAGIPHFVACFGRDSLIASFEFLMMNSRQAKSTLRELARHQGQKINRQSEEEPGKIHHEIRGGERSDPAVYPYTYGTVDASPLFVVLLDHYLLWTGDIDFVREMEPILRGILEWCAQYGDIDQDGFIEYENLKEGQLGLTHRGWKDGEPAAVTMSDGTLPSFPIAMVEVQGYYYDALVGLARMFDLLGDQQTAKRCNQAAEALKRKFNEQFWWPEEQFFAMALDGDKNIVDSVGSNAGHCLMGDLVDPDKRKLLARRFLQDDLFSGFGVRTLSTHARGYSAARYQRGAVWAHDNALIAYGLSRHGDTREANRIASGILQAAAQFPNGRLPELFSGLSRHATNDKVVPIPIACQPQGWAAASPFLLLQAVLGIFPDALNRRITVRPDLVGAPFARVSVRDLAFAGGALSMEFTVRDGRTIADIVEQDGDFDIRIEQAKPSTLDH
ncbi:MAG: hypothetical protein IIA66_04390 [Planctomycetes bacterium]|nr:hypothetical protein [Planctomycetota bacterium]